MADISTFARWKDWLLITLFGLLLTLLGLVAGDNRRRIERIESDITNLQALRQDGFERLRAVEQSIAGGPVSREDARDIEQRLQRQIDALERRCDYLGQRIGKEASSRSGQ